MLMLNRIARRAASLWRADRLPIGAAIAWRAEWIIGLSLVALGVVLFLLGWAAAQTAPREHADAGMFGVVMGPLAIVAGIGLVLAALSLRAPGRWRWAGQATAALAVLYLGAKCAG
jgi:uncharacterized membrane protein